MVELSEELQGALIGIFGSTLNALGLVLQKYSHVTNAGADGVAKRPYVLQKWWIIGFMTFLAAQIINTVPMTMTPQLVTACFGSWTMLCNTLFARIILKETLNIGQALSMCGLVLAVILVVLNSPKPDHQKQEENHDIECLGARFVSGQFLTLTGFYVALVCIVRLFASLFASRSEDCDCVHCGRRDHEHFEDECSDTRVSGSSAGEHDCASDSMRSVLEPASWAICAALAVGYTSLLFRVVAGILAGAAEGLNGRGSPFNYWQTYPIIVAALCVAPVAIHCLNLALLKGDAIFVVCTYESLGILTQLSMGAVFFRELSSFTSLTHMVVFGFGVLLMLIFVIALTVAQAANEEVKEKEEKEGKEKVALDKWKAPSKPIVPAGPTMSIVVPAGSPGTEIQVPHPKDKNKVFFVKVPAGAKVGQAMLVPVPDVSKCHSAGSAVADGPSVSGAPLGKTEKKGGWSTGAKIAAGLGGAAVVGGAAVLGAEIAEHGAEVTFDAIGDGVGDAATAVGEVAGDAGEAIGEFVGEASDFIMDLV